MVVDPFAVVRALRRHSDEGKIGVAHDDWRHAIAQHGVQIVATLARAVKKEDQWPTPRRQRRTGNASSSYSSGRLHCSTFSSCLLPRVLFCPQLCSLH